MVKFKVLVNRGSLRDCTVGKIYEGKLHKYKYFVFIDDVGDRVTAEINGRLEKVEEITNMKFKHEYHYVPKELITNESIYSAVVYALEKAGGVVSKGFGAYGDGHRDSKGLSIADSSRILWSRGFATEPVTLQQLFNHEDFKWPEGMDKIGYLKSGKVVFYGGMGYRYTDLPVNYAQPAYEWHSFNHEPTGITLIATKESQGENMNKEFKKDMLVAGKHVVRYSDDDSLNLVLQVGDSLYLVDLNSDMYSAPVEDSDIKEVYVIEEYTTLDRLKRGYNLKLVWERKEKSQQEIEYESLMQKIAELEAQARKLKP